MSVTPEQTAIHDLVSGDDPLTIEKFAGKSKAQLANGRPVRGRLVASIAPVPPRVHVDPQTGRVVEGASPSIP